MSEFEEELIKIVRLITEVKSDIECIHSHPKTGVPIYIPMQKYNGYIGNEVVPYFKCFLCGCKIVKKEDF